MTENLVIEILELRRKLLDAREMVKALDDCCVQKPNCYATGAALKHAKARLKELENDNALCELMFQS